MKTHFTLVLHEFVNCLQVLVLYGNLGVLGLLILQKHTRRPKSTDYSIFRFIQAVVRFLWDAHNCEEAREEEELVVSTPYIEHWNDLIDLWYLGMQVRQIPNSIDPIHLRVGSWLYLNVPTFHSILQGK